MKLPPGSTEVQGRRRTAGGGEGSIIVLVMVALLFTSAALVAFLDKASTDLLVEARAAQAARLRPDAYSALEVTLAVLQDFFLTDGNALHAPTEGWSDPLGWAGWTPSDPNHTVDVTFEDESGKIPLIHADPISMLALFESAGYGYMVPGDAQKLVDGILGWMQQNYTPASSLQPDYQQSSLPYAAPGRPLRSLSELAAIDDVRDVFFDANGRPNSLWWQFDGDFSIFNYRNPDINGAKPDVLTAVGQFDQQQEGDIASYLAGTSTLSTLGRKWFTNRSDLQSITGVAGQTGGVSQNGAAVQPGAFAFTIRALRITITVREGNQSYTLSTVVAPSNGATDVLTTATDVQNAVATASGQPTGETATNNSLNTGSQMTTKPNNAQQTAMASVNIQFPFTILEIRENDAILTPPPPPSSPTDDAASDPTVVPPPVTNPAAPSA